MTKTQAWIKAFRLRTLPLSVSGVIMGSFLALKKNVFDIRIFILAIATTLFLQILSNLANDYGDGKNGKDNAGRLGPARMVQSGKITLPEMKRMIYIFCVLSLLSGISLIFISQIQIMSVSFFILLFLGLLSIWAALSYTIGKNPYGYSGWGDLSVFIFFGLFSVLGTCFLYSHVFSLDLIFPAISVGAFSVGVLNLNNMRDYTNDLFTGKKTLVVKMGALKAKRYHIFLFGLAIVNAIVYLLVNDSAWLGYLFLIIIIPVFLHGNRIMKITEPLLFDKELKKLALIALFFSIVFGTCINF
jgi:1,4-dihydroxy-2-naphthoate polyprenyltransferase